MRFYSKQHKYYCGVDLHAQTMYVCIIDQQARIVKQKNIKSNPPAFLKVIDKCRDDLVVSAECMFTWYWLADLCAREIAKDLLSTSRMSVCKRAWRPIFQPLIITAHFYLSLSTISAKRQRFMTGILCSGLEQFLVSVKH